MSHKYWLMSTFVVLLVLGSTGQADEAPNVPFFTGLGKHTRAIGTKNADAQKYFDQGLNFTFAFNHDEATRAFEAAAKRDPEVAMPYWGIALNQGININDPGLTPERVKKAIVAIEMARSKAKTPVEKALVEALAKRYVDPLPADRSALEKAYSAAMKEVWATFPKDADVGAFYAESLMNLRPWQLWTKDGKPAPETPEIVRTLEAVMALDEHHPLALHLYIHALEASPTPEKADQAANRLRGAQPALGHLLHMPSHIDIRRGRWNEAIEANRLAIDADRKYATVSQKQFIYRFYMAHNFMMGAYAMMMQGESKRSMALVREMLADIPSTFLAVPEQAAMMDSFFCTPLEIMKRFGQWDAILKEPDLGDAYPISRTMRYYARGVAYAAKGDTASARKEQELFQTHADRISKDAIFGGNTARDVLAIARDMLEGEICMAEGKTEAGFNALRSAVAKEDGLRYSEPPDWIVPVRHALGAFLLKDGQAAEAEKVYREDLKHWPDNGWSLYGLADALEVQGKLDEAKAVRLTFDRIWKHADMKIAASCLCVPKQKAKERGQRP